MSKNCNYTMLSGRVYGVDHLVAASGQMVWKEIAKSHS